MRTFGFIATATVLLATTIPAISAPLRTSIRTELVPRVADPIADAGHPRSQLATTVAPREPTGGSEQQATPSTGGGAAQAEPQPAGPGPPPDASTAPLSGESGAGAIEDADTDDENLESVLSNSHGDIDSAWDNVYAESLRAKPEAPKVSQWHVDPDAAPESLWHNWSNIPEKFEDVFEALPAEMVH